jgi:hypothetical protein
LYKISWILLTIFLFRSQERDERYQHLYAEFLIILEERNRLLEISNQLQSEIQQIQHCKKEYVKKEQTPSNDCDPWPENSDVQNFAKSLWTNSVRAHLPSSAVPTRSTDRVTESQRQVRRRMQRAQIRKMATDSSQREIHVRNWNRKDD